MPAAALEHSHELLLGAGRRQQLQASRLRSLRACQPPKRTAASCECQQRSRAVTSQEGAPSANSVDAHQLSLSSTSQGWASARRAAGAALAALQLTAALGLSPFLLPPGPAHALLNSPNAQIPRTVDAALRRSIPAFNADVKEVQSVIEDVAFKLRIPQRKSWGAMQDDVNTATRIIQQNDKVMYGVQPNAKGEGQRLVSLIAEDLRRVSAAIDAKDPDKTAQRVGTTLHDVAELELLQAPGISFAIPKEYADLPRLTGRAVVEVVIERPDGSLSFVDNGGGGPQAQAHLELVLDGYSAPIGAANFVLNVQHGLYKGVPLNVSFASILAGAGRAPGKTIPLENLPAGQFDPVYRLPLEVQSGELPVLPLSIFGAVAMAHTADPEDGLAAGDEFFIYKFDRQNLGGLSGLAFDEGKFGVFGYVTKGTELIYQLQPGDVIVDAKVVSGEDRLVLPQGS